MDVHGNELCHWLALWHTPGIGARTFQLLLEYYHSPRAVFEAGEKEWQAIKLSARTRAALAQPDWAAVERDLQWARAEGRYILTLTDPAYPALLKEITDPPAVLYVMGPACLQQPQLAMVGSRSASATGRETAWAFARELARSGLIITSGLASGIDAASHAGALAGNGVTIAVAGTGLDQVYPARHQSLAQDIVQRGAIISEFPIGTRPLAANFPRRNRIISGLSQGVLVVEAALRSGSLITARMALEQGREVFAIPGSIHSPLAKGCNNLLREGAKLVETAADIIEELGHYHSNYRQDVVSHVEVNVPSLDEAYEKLLACIGYEPVGVDAIVSRSGLTAESVCSMLLVLELHGMLETTVGGLYCQTGKRTNDERKYSGRADVSI